jgi:hypothetical protein
VVKQKSKPNLTQRTTAVVRPVIIVQSLTAANSFRMNQLEDVAETWLDSENDFMDEEEDDVMNEDADEESYSGREDEGEGVDSELDGEMSDNMSAGGDGNDEEEDGDSHSVDFARFQNLLTRLYRNDPSLTTIDCNGGPVGYGRLLGLALLGNTHVSHLEFLHYTDDAREAIGDIATLSPLFLYLEQAVALRALILIASTTEFVGACLKAVSANKHVEILRLYVWLTNANTSALATLVRSTRTLRELFLGGKIENALVLATALGANRSLWSLRLHTHGDTLSAILPRLSGNNYLRFLSMSHDETSVDSNDDVHMGLYTYLSHPSCSVKQLELQCFCFNQKRILQLHAGLSSNRSLAHLNLEWCRFSTEAASLFASRLTLNGDEGGLKSIEVLEVAFRKYDWPYGGNVVNALVVGMPNLQLLFWKWNDLQESVLVDVSAVWNGISANASKIHLRRMYAQYFLTEGNDAMNSCIVQLVYLRELHFEEDNLRFHANEYNAGEVVQKFFLAVRQNRSLHSLTVSGTFPIFWSHRHARIILASLERNEQLPQVLVASRIDPSGDGSVIMSDASLFPTLFHVAMQAPRMAPTSILTGLLTLNDSICGSAK